MTRPGLINRRVELYRDEGTTQGIYGEHVEDWTLIGSRWAEIQPGRGREVFSDDSERASQAVTFTIRADEVTRTLTPADRVIDKDTGIQYDIQAVADKQTRHRYIDLLTLRRSPEANRIP